MHVAQLEKVFKALEKLQKAMSNIVCLLQPPGSRQQSRGSSESTPNINSALYEQGVSVLTCKKGILQAQSSLDSLKKGAAALAALLPTEREEHLNCLSKVLCLVHDRLVRCA